MDAHHRGAPDKHLHSQRRRCFSFASPALGSSRTRVARTEAARANLGIAARVGDLPEGIRPGDGDPWAEANRRRAAGDLAGAVVCLFAYQLLALDQLGLDPARAGPDGPPLRAIAPRSRVDRLGGRDPWLVRGCLLRSEAAHRPAFESVWLRHWHFRSSQRTLGAGVCAMRAGSTRVRPRRAGGRGLCDVAGSWFRGLRAGPRQVRQEPGASLNGTSVFAADVAQRGQEVRTAIRLTDGLADWADGIVRFAPIPVLPSLEEAAVVP